MCMHVSIYILRFTHIDLHVLLACAHIFVYTQTHKCFQHGLYIHMYIHMHIDIDTYKDPLVLPIHAQRYKSILTYMQVCTYT